MQLASSLRIIRFIISQIQENCKIRAAKTSAKRDAPFQDAVFWGGNRSGGAALFPPARKSGRGQQNKGNFHSEVPPYFLFTFAAESPAKPVRDPAAIYIHARGIVREPTLPAYRAAVG